MSIDKVVIQGAEFTRVADRYLLQSEVEAALAKTRPTPIAHVQRLTTLLEDIVNAADAVALEVAEAHMAQRFESTSAPDDQPARQMLRQVRAGLHDQLLTIDNFMQRLDG